MWHFYVTILSRHCKLRGVIARALGSGETSAVRYDIHFVASCFLFSDVQHCIPRCFKYIFHPFLFWCLSPACVLGYKRRKTLESSLFSTLFTYIPCFKMSVMTLLVLPKRRHCFPFHITIFSALKHQNHANFVALKLRIHCT